MDCHTYIMKPDYPFAAYMTVFGLMGAWAVYYCLSPLTPAPLWREVFGAIAWPTLCLGGLFMMRRQEKTP